MTAASCGKAAMNGAPWANIEPLPNRKNVLTFSPFSIDTETSFERFFNNQALPRCGHAL